jgi:hypothetical protein
MSLRTGQPGGIERIEIHRSRHAVDDQLGEGEAERLAADLAAALAPGRRTRLA